KLKSLETLDGKSLWSVLKIKPVSTEGALFSNTNMNMSTDLYYYIDTTGYNTYKPIYQDKTDADGNVVTDDFGDPVQEVVGYEENATIAPYSHWFGVWDKGGNNGEGLTAYSPKIGGKYYVQDMNKNGEWVELTVKTASTLSYPANYKGFVKVPQAAFEGIWGAASDKDGCFNGPIEFVNITGNQGGDELKGAEVIFDDFGFYGYEYQYPLEPVLPAPMQKYDETPATSDATSNATSDDTPITSDDTPITSDEPFTGAEIGVEVVGNPVAGGKVTVKVNIPGNLNFAAGALTLNYDKDLLSIAQETVDGDVVDLINGGKFKGSPVINAAEVGKIIVAYASEKPLNVAGSILEVTFNVSENFKNTDVAKILVEITEMFDINTNPIEYKVNQTDVKYIEPITSETPVTSETPATSTDVNTSEGAETSTDEIVTEETTAPDEAETSTPSTSIPDTGATGVAGVASALAVTAVAVAAAVVLKKKK
ncbi:MAG: hypothetical protein RR483_02150, partial [Clostridia bacterium]